MTRVETIEYTTKTGKTLELKVIIGNDGTVTDHRGNRSERVSRFVGMVRYAEENGIDNRVSGPESARYKRF